MPLPAPAKKIAKAVHQPASSSKSSSVLGSLFRSQDDNGKGELIDLTTCDSDTEEDSFHSTTGSDLYDTPESSNSTDRSSQTPDVSTPYSNPAKSASLAKEGPTWALFRQDHADDGLQDRIFLPIPLVQPNPAIKPEPHDDDDDLEEPEEAVFELQEVPEAREEVSEAREEVLEAREEVTEAREEVPEAREEAHQPEQRMPDTVFAKVQVVEPPSSDKADSAEIAQVTPRKRSLHTAPFMVVESHMRVKIMQKQKDGRLAVPWGVQYYLASLASLDYVSLDELNPAKGTDALRSNSNLASIRALFDPANQQLLWESHNDMVITARRATDRELSVYEELDRESEILADDPLNGVIGPPGEEMRSYGGRVIFEGRLICTQVDEKTRGGKNSKHRRISVQLFPPKLGGSCRFSRRFGSESIVRLKMDPAMAKDARRFPNHPKHQEIQQEILHLFQRPIQILGRYYRPFFCKEETIFYLWVDSVHVCSDRPKLNCIWDLVDHHGPFAENSGSQLGKYIQRMQLGLSTSLPASIIDTITYIPDIFGDPDPVTGKPQEMTDGAGIASLAVFKDITKHLGYGSIPAAFQGRIAGAKGVWTLDPAAGVALHGDEAKRWVQVRDSQKKLQYPADKPLDLSQTVVDLLGPSRTFAPSTLSRQIILVMQSNGVPIDTFADMQRSQLQAIANEISNWEEKDLDTDRMRLLTVVDRYCKVEATKAKRSTQAAEHRAQGMANEIRGDSTTDRDPYLGDDDREIFFGPDGRHRWNGMPVSKHERAYDMLLQGFHPVRCGYLADLLLDVADLAMRKLIKKFAIPVSRSAEAIVIPDPTGTLEEDEMQFNFSGDGVQDPEDSLWRHHVPEGDVLVTRHPCLLPTDVRKVRAVFRRELAMYKDVVVFSTKGQRPLASLLSGGDYDGDLIRVFWEPKLVEPFENADVRYADCPFPIEDVFERSDRTVAEFVAEHADKGIDERDRALIKELVAGAFQPAVQGLYGAMHLYAAWQFGTHSKESVDLAHKFCQCMDSAKTGLSINPRIRMQDSKNYLGDLPEWGYDAVDESDPKDWFALEDRHKNVGTVKNQQKPDSVLCRLWEEGKIEVGLLKARMLKQVEGLRGVEDQDITRAWSQASSLRCIPEDVLKAIRTHVSIVEQSYAQTNARTRREIESRSREARKGATAAKSKSKKEERQLGSVPLRRVRSEAASSVVMDRLETTDGQRAGGNSGAVDDLNRDDLLNRLDGTIEVPVTLGSASEVAARFCQWPKGIVKEHMSKMSDEQIEYLEKLRASYAYSITYCHKPRFAFEMAWEWIMDLKAKATGKKQAHGSGRVSLPTASYDLLAARTRIIKRNVEMLQGRGVEIDHP
uniref:RNA-dependent RNA polymerase n=1 Tax=Kalmanozyma brasiliensis (strain GHG001) TaxID=1365824 RepID=V5GHL2_KALBG